MNFGINMDVIERVIIEYEGVFVIECSDEVRVLCFFEFRFDRSGILELIGMSWNLDVLIWDN